MIVYPRGGLSIFCRVFQCRGSVFPTSMTVALPCAAITAIVKLCIDQGYMGFLDEDSDKSILRDNSIWSGFLFLVGFLTVFRTSQAYTRFWDGLTSMHTMRAEWFDACAALIAFCKHAGASDEAVLNFQHILIRLFSMLHAVALAEIEDSQGDCKAGRQVAHAFKYELVDATALDQQSLKAVRRSPAKVELVFQWIQQFIVENIDNQVLSIPAPILSRAFQEIANGMVAFHEANKISRVPFPFPYTQCCECLLLIHWICTPLVVSQYVSTPWWGALFSFLQVFIYWSLNAIAVEIENPFGLDANDIDASTMQRELNRHLLLLLDPATKRTPRLSADISLAMPPQSLLGCGHGASLSEIWRGLTPSAEDVEQIGSRLEGVPWEGYATSSSRTRESGRCCSKWLWRSASAPRSEHLPDFSSRGRTCDSIYQQASVVSRGPTLPRVRSRSSDPREAGTGVAEATDAMPFIDTGSGVEGQPVGASSDGGQQAASKGPPVDRASEAARGAERPWGRPLDGLALAQEPPPLDGREARSPSSRGGRRAGDKHSPGAGSGGGSPDSPKARSEPSRSPSPTQRAPAAQPEGLGAGAAGRGGGGALPPEQRVPPVGQIAGSAALVQVPPLEQRTPPLEQMPGGPAVGQEVQAAAATDAAVVIGNGLHGGLAAALHWQSF